MAPRRSVVAERRSGAVGRRGRWLGRVDRPGRAAAARRAALLAVTTVAGVVPVVVAAAGVTCSRQYVLGTRARFCVRLGLDHVPEHDFRLLFRMTGEDFWALHAAVQHHLVVDESIATLSSGAPIPTKCRLALGLRMLARASYLDCMLSFGVSRFMVHSIFHQV